MSEVKVNKISPRSGTDVTLGDSGDTFTIPSGATINNQGTAVNFGATGSASWVTTVKTGDFTAVAGEGYFVNTTSGEIDVTLPASPSAGAVVAIKDYANTFDTNSCILLRNGSNIGGLALNSTISTEGLAVTLVFVDATKGWLVTDSGLQSEVPGPLFVSATGGTIFTSGNFKTHVFTGPGTFTVCSAGNCAGSNKVDYLVVAGGGSGGGAYRGSGGGAGGFRVSNSVGCVPAPSMSPLVAPASLPVTATGFPITVGAGASGVGASVSGTQGSNTTFSTIIATGGGFGHSCASPCKAGVPGGSGGGGGGCVPGGTVGGSGNTPPVSPPQGQNGGAGGAAPSWGGAGGGASAVGGVGGINPQPAPARTNTGGAGSFIATAFVSSSTPDSDAFGVTGPAAGRYFAGGGGGGNYPTPGPGPQPIGGGGKGGGGNYSAATGGTNTTGGGGGGTSGPGAGNSGSGGSGIVIIRYKFQ